MSLTAWLDVIRSVAGQSGQRKVGVELGVWLLDGQRFILYYNRTMSRNHICGTISAQNSYQRIL